MGTSAAPFKVVLDTGSDWTVVAGKNCTTCTGNTFDPYISGVEIDKNDSAKAYGSAILEGRAFSDRACFGVNCVSSFEYFLVSK